MDNQENSTIPDISNILKTNDTTYGNGEHLDESNINNNFQYSRR